MNAVVGEAITQGWQPEVAEPHIAIYGIEELGPRLGNGEGLCRWLIEHSTQITFPATDPSTKVDDCERETLSWQMRYSGPNFFSSPDAPDEVLALSALYNGAMLRVWEQEFGLSVRPLDLTERAAEAFITNPRLGEGADPHNDTRLTVAGYPAPGAGLIVSHCVNARNLTDIREQPSTLVLPRAESFVFLLGTEHPHTGINPGIENNDDVATRRAKFATACAQYRIVNWVQNLYEKDRFGPSNPEERGPTAIPNLLRGLPGLDDRVVLSFNFDDGTGSGSSLDRVLGNDA